MSQASREDIQFKDNKPSFFIRMFYRQNASWQGEVQWMEGRQVKRFRSALELLALIQEAMDVSGAPENTDAIRRWQDDEENSKHPALSYPRA